MLFTVTSTSGFYSPALDFLDLRFLQFGLRFRKKENLIENHPPPPHGFRNPYKNSVNEENSSLIMNIAFCTKPKPKVETSRLRNLKSMPRNLNEIVLS
jgi:hypothetical protein